MALSNVDQKTPVILHGARHSSPVTRHPSGEWLFPVPPPRLTAHWRRVKPDSKTAAMSLYALVFGLFLGLCVWKFGDPVVLDHIIDAPATAQDFFNDPWPTHWANWFLVPLAAWGAILILQRNPAQNCRAALPSYWLWLLPLGWLAWQFAAGSRTVAGSLTANTLWQYGGCVACYFLGALLFSRDQWVRWLMVGLLAAFAFCLVRAVDQRLFEYPQNYQVLVEGERNGWTNFPPATLLDLKHEGIILSSNNVYVANPVILSKFQRGRVCGTLVYPNALAEIILLLWPVSLTLAFGATRRLRPLVRYAAIALTLFLGGAAFFWTGSKLGWLLAIALAGIVVFRLNWSKNLKFAAIGAVVLIGLGVFAVRFHHYFAAGATSAGARFDYWRAAVQITGQHPFFGTGPGTFGQLYERIKAPTSEMARLTHNDYLEQFCDSGIPGGLVYTAWILLTLAILGKTFWPPPIFPGDARPAKIAAALEADSNGPFRFAIFLGLLGWFAQGLGEFGLFVPALAWTAFTLLGALVARRR
jgi:hypothetical protein